MRVAIVNFSQQNMVTPEEVSAAIQSLPSFHYASIQLVYFDPSRTMATELAHEKKSPSTLKAKGTYYHDWNTSFSMIVIYPFPSRKAFYHTLFHEIGHHVFFHALDQPQRNEWFFNIRKTESGFVTSAARKNSREDFAETYACYCCRPERLTRAPKKRDFMARTVFQKPGRSTIQKIV